MLLLHGFPEFWWGWRRQLPALAAAGYRVVAPDLPGYNLSDKPKGLGPYGLDRLSDVVRGLIDRLEVTSLPVIGHDWGGVVASSVVDVPIDNLAPFFIIADPDVHPDDYGEVG